MANKKNNTYNQDSISALKGADRVRLRPGVIFGSASIEGCTHSVFEIISNSVDEAKEGYGNRIVLKYTNDGEATVTDFGRGIPLDWNENEQRYNWDLIFCELYAGGKYGDESYETSLGLNGLGACATQYASEYMEVIVYRDGLRYSIQFEKGKPITELKKEPTDRVETGSSIKFKPDLEVFDSIIIDHDILKDMLRIQAMLHKGVTFVLELDGEEPIEYMYEQGIPDYLEDIVEEKIIPITYKTGSLTGRDREDKPEYTVNMEMAFTFTRKERSIDFYHNSSDLSHGGVHASAMKKALLTSFTKLIKANKDFKNIKIKYPDVEDIFSCIISTTCPGHMTHYENQTKKAVDNAFIETALIDFIQHSIAEWSYANPDDTVKILKEIEINKKSREASETARSQIFKNLKSDSFGIGNLPHKFVNCTSKDSNLRELYIVEGDSALGSCKLARNGATQAIMPLRGKILNCLKADILKISKSDIIMDLVKVLGCGIEVSDKALKDLAKFDLAHLRWSKIIICTDADVDGMQIRTLIITMLYRLCPTLLKEGYIYIAETPLFEITHLVGKKENTYFAYSDSERDNVLAKLTTGKVIVQRSKGLGENEPEMMEKTTMNPNTRKLTQVVYSDNEATKARFSSLLGDDLQGRKDLIAEFAAKHTYSNLDIS